jgi:hypothetical protein
VEGLEIGVTYQNIKNFVGTIDYSSESYNFNANI